VALHLVIGAYKQTDFGETYTTVGKLTTFRDLISLVRNPRWIIARLDLVTAFVDLKVDDNDIYLTLPRDSLEGLNTPTIIVRLQKALNGLKQAPQRWHNNISTFFLSLKFAQSHANPNLYLHSDGI